MVILKKYIKNGTFRNFLKSKFDPNIHQRRSKLQHIKKISSGAGGRGGGMPPNSFSKAHGFKFRNLKKKLLAPLPNPSYAPDILLHLRIHGYTLTCKQMETSQKLGGDVNYIAALYQKSFIRSGSWWTLLFTVFILWYSWTTICALNIIQISIAAKKVSVKDS